MASLTCLYCPEPLTQATREAHYIPSAIGGRLSSRAVCCDDCNNALSAVERTFCHALADLTALVGVLRGDREQAPPTEVSDPKHGTVRMWGGYPQSIPAKMKFSRVENGRTHFQVSGSDPDATARQLAHLLRRYRKTPDDLASGNGITLDASETRAFSGPIQFSIDLFSDPRHARVVTKIALEILAHHHPEAARRAELEPVARYVRYGGPPADVRADWATQGPLGMPCPPFHSCEVWTAGRYMIARVVLYGAFAFTASLSDEWKGQPVTALHAVDPVNGQLLLNAASNNGWELPVEWPSRGAEAADWQSHVRRLNECLQRRMLDVTSAATAKDITAEWIADLGGRPPSLRDFQSLQERVAAEIDFLNKRQDETTPLDRAVLLEKVRTQYILLERQFGPVKPKN